MEDTFNAGILQQIESTNRGDKLLEDVTNRFYIGQTPDTQEIFETQQLIKEILKSNK